MSKEELEKWIYNNEIKDESILDLCVRVENKGFNEALQEAEKKPDDMFHYELGGILNNPNTSLIEKCKLITELFNKKIEALRKKE